jgi:hypothetical protein
MDWVFQVDVFWVVTPSSVVVGYQRFGGPCCLHLQGEDGGNKVLRNVGILGFTLKMETARSSGKLVS